MDIRAISTIPLTSLIRKRELAMFFGKRLKEFRQDFNLSRYALGYKTGFSEHTIRDYERGKRTPCYRFLCALQRTFGVDINQFLPQDEMDLWEVLL